MLEKFRPFKRLIKSYTRVPNTHFIFVREYACRTLSVPAFCLALRARRCWHPGLCSRISMRFMCVCVCVYCIYFNGCVGTVCASV